MILFACVFDSHLQVLDRSILKISGGVVLNLCVKILLSDRIVFIAWTRKYQFALGNLFDSFWWEEELIECFEIEKSFLRVKISVLIFWLIYRFTLNVTYGLIDRFFQAVQHAGKGFDVVF